MGKGDTPRPMDKEKFDSNYDRVFGNKPFKTWRNSPRFAKGSLVYGESGNELPEEPDRQENSETSEIVEGERC